jgi:aspartate aminotransferase-like enzyme/GNAT superfamily N-acetyltransferase
LAPHVRIATEEWEFEAIHRLNHRTFAEEIPQHQPDSSSRLVDRFHHQNAYIIGLSGRELWGMLAVRGERPFSLDDKLPNLDTYIPAGRRVCELRLLAVEPQHRAGRLAHLLLRHVWRYCLDQGYDVAIISGTTRQLKLYRHLGFVPFGPLVGSATVRFQPMMLTLERALPRAGKLFREPSVPSGATETVNLLPGPVNVHPDVRRALLEEPDSHRSPSFDLHLTSTRALLCHLAGAEHAQILLGSGTLANDVIAAQLSLLPGPGLILSNGEFGERLVDHATRFSLACEVMQWPWGEPFDLMAVERRLSVGPVPRWVWFAHLETSTGVLNDLDALKVLCRRTAVKLSVDAISSFGTAPLDVEGTYFASAVSGKGLGAFAGLAIVFYNHAIEASSGRLPRYLDLGLYAVCDGVPFTQSSNLLRALEAALDRVDWARRFRVIAERTAELRRNLRESGFDLVAPEAHAAPGVVTIALPATMSGFSVGKELQDRGYMVATNSEYLRRRNWIQISLMSQPSRAELARVVEALGRICPAIHR